MSIHDIEYGTSLPLVPYGSESEKIPFPQELEVIDDIPRPVLIQVYQNAFERRNDEAKETLKSNLSNLRNIEDLRHYGKLRENELGEQSFDDRVDQFFDGSYMDSYEILAHRLDKHGLFNTDSAEHVLERISASRELAYEAIRRHSPPRISKIITYRSEEYAALRMKSTVGLLRAADGQVFSEKSRQVSIVREGAVNNDDWVDIKTLERREVDSADDESTAAIRARVASVITSQNTEITPVLESLYLVRHRHPSFS